MIILGFFLYVVLLKRYYEGIGIGLRFTNELGVKAHPRCFYDEVGFNDADKSNCLMLIPIYVMLTRRKPANTA